LKPKKQIKDIWGWLNEITLYKTPIDQISDDSWDHWNSYVIHRFISMNLNFVELANFIQIIPYEKKKQTYQIYREFIPNQKVYLKYIKSKIKGKNKELVKKVADYFSCSSQEAQTYLDLLGKKGTREILEKIGTDEKELKKLLK
tara:strand:+ start:149 stop:580 length:432 start_codon:yes stop_codon:yes gene_type:complete